MSQRIVQLLQELIKIDSQNPGSDERKIIAFIRGYLKQSGVSSRIYEFKKNRPNLVCRVRSKKSKKTILFTPHVDTVPVTRGWKFPPFDGTIKGGRIYGRGATDCKANVAVCLWLIKKLQEKKEHLENLDVVFAFCADEETGSHYGTLPLMKRLQGIDYGVVLDADDFDIIIAQKGLLHIHVDLWGKEAHGAYPERGVNAVQKGMEIINEMMKHKIFLKRHSLLEKPTINIGRFMGGEKVNIVAGQAFFELDIRYLPEMTKEEIIRELRIIIEKRNINYKITTLAAQTPIEIDTNSILIQTLLDVLKANRIPAKLKPSFGATVINFLKDQGIETFAFGFGTRGCAHIKDEYVVIDNLVKGAAVLKAYVHRLDRYVGVLK